MKCKLLIPTFSPSLLYSLWTVWFLFACNIFWKRKPSLQKFKLQGSFIIESSNQSPIKILAILHLVWFEHLYTPRRHTNCVALFWNFWRLYGQICTNSYLFSYTMHFIWFCLCHFTTQKFLFDKFCCRFWWREGR